MMAGRIDGASILGSPKKVNCALFSVSIGKRVRLGGGGQVLREMYGVMIEHQASKMIIVTSGGYTAEAITFAQGKRLWLVNGSELVHMIEEGRSLTQKPVIEEPSSQFPPKLCPNCHSELAVRIANKGPNAGKSFYGCTAFPKCRYTCDC